MAIAARSPYRADDLYKMKCTLHKFCRPYLTEWQFYVVGLFSITQRTTHRAKSQHSYNGWSAIHAPDEESMCVFYSSSSRLQIVPGLDTGLHSSSAPFFVTLLCNYECGSFNYEKQKNNNFNNFNNFEIYRFISL